MWTKNQLKVLLFRSCGEGKSEKLPLLTESNKPSKLIASVEIFMVLCVPCDVCFKSRWNKWKKDYLINVFYKMGKSNIILNTKHKLLGTSFLFAISFLYCVYIHNVLSLFSHILLKITEEVESIAFSLWHFFLFYVG